MYDSFVHEYAVKKATKLFIHPIEFTAVFTNYRFLY